jgi:hypothetical protein
MIIGAHAILYSRNAEADRAFLRDVFAFPSVDVGEGWLIFGLPPSEVAVHPGDKNDVHELYLMCDDVAAFVTEVRKKGAACGPVLNRGWGLLTEMTLPGGGKIGVYQPRHARPLAAVVPAGRTATRGRARARAKPARGKPARRKAARRPPARKR